MEPVMMKLTQPTLTFKHFHFSMELSDPRDETVTLALPFA
jgi:hypothetical protein